MHRRAGAPALDALIAILLAPSCACCARLLDRPTEGPVCAACWQAIRPITPPVCESCGDPLPSWRTVGSLRQAQGDAEPSRRLADAPRCVRCRRGRRAVDRGRAIGLYDGALREIIHAFKYQRRRSIGRALAARLRIAGAGLLRDADVVVPVPLHRRRRRQRGFNQAADLARGLGLPVLEALRRVRATRSQVELPAAQRHGNVRNAFELVPPRRDGWLCRREAVPALEGLCVVLVDDVSTTGATLDACARVLKAAGVREVRALTAARVAGWRR